MDHKHFSDLVAATSGADSLSLSMVDEQIAILTLNRPDARNAINAALVPKITRAIEVIERDPAIAVAILTGAGSAFCAGADLKEVAAGGLNALFTEKGGLGGFSHADRSKPWIAAVEGAALAGGFELALACDMIVASSSATFGLPEVKRGLIASAGGIYRLPRNVPRHIALEMIVTGEPIEAERASSLGLINRLVPVGSALPVAIEHARTISQNAPIAVRESLRIARLAFDRAEAELYQLGEEAQLRLQSSQDYAEGSRAFVEKRAPIWTGR